MSSKRGEKSYGRKSFLSGQKDDNTPQSMENITDPPPDVPMPRPLSPKLYDRLNASLEPEAFDTVQKKQRQLLAQIGVSLYDWRIAHGYKREVLATRLDMDTDLLLCLEQEIIWPEDIDRIQMITLYNLIAEDKQDSRLKELIAHYLGIRE